MPSLFPGRNVLVTGGASGIGQATANIFRGEGANVWTASLEALDDPQHIALDLSAPGSAAQLLDQTGPLDVAILNAGIAQPAGLFETTPENWRRTQEVNVSATFFLLQELARRMLFRPDAAIVLTASTNSFDGEENLIAYNASKAALLGLVHTAANELGPYRIRVNAVCPGFIRTPLTESNFQNETFMRRYFGNLPLGRAGRPEEVAEAIVFLASPRASYITGVTLFVDGGQMATKFGTWGQPDDRFEGTHWTRNPDSRPTPPQS
ncbi:MAG: SDR family oxidoreductase [Bryobacter sp.]|nr:SDR family oxidoreductase [Bryobacter sp.]